LHAVFVAGYRADEKRQQEQKTKKPVRPPFAFPAIPGPRDKFQISNTATVHLCPLNP